MRAFWRFAAHMLRERWTLMWAMVFAFITAAGLSVGLLALVPMLRLILDEKAGQSLQAMAREYNAGSGGGDGDAVAAGPLVTIPQWLVDLLPTDKFEGVVWVVVGMGVLLVIGATTTFFHQYLSMTVTTRTVARVRQLAFEQVIRLPLARVVERGPAEFISRIIRDTAELQRGFIALTSKAVAQATKGLAAFAVALWIGQEMTYIAVPTAVVVIVILRKFGKRIRRGTKGSLAAQEGLLRIANESLQGLRVLKSNTAEPEAARRFDVINQVVVREELKVRLARAMSGPVVETLAMFAVGGLAVIAAKQIIDGNLLFEQFAVTLGSLGVAAASFRPLTGLVNEIQAASAPAQRLAEILREEPEEEENGTPKPDLLRHQELIEFDRVTVFYPAADRPAVDEVSLRVRHGERVALVGPNGSGKTTLLSLLPRLLTPTSGRILIDHRDINTVNLLSLRSQIAVVTQETVLFRGSVAENIAFGLADAPREKIIAAAKRAHAHGFIEDMKGGYDASIAEQGASLSGGQRQRLAIARAILRDPAILILDEATSQVDAESEAGITAALQEFSRGRTVMIIAHRLATVINADRIVVMENGRILDVGTHEELLERCDLYRRLSHTQLVADAPVATPTVHEEKPEEAAAAVEVEAEDSLSASPAGDGAGETGGDGGGDA